MKLAIATCTKQPQLAESDKPLIPLFERSGVTVEPAIWNDENVNWQSYDGVLIRSVWDYHLHPVGFGNWLTMLKAKSVYTLNPVATIRQNQHKFYLKQLQQKGIEIVPTVFLDKTENLDLSEIKTLGWEKAVIKPAVSASAFLTRLFAVNDLQLIEREFKEVASERELLVQPFMPEVTEQGEISMLFFNRKYSHAVLKVPQRGDFRVQKEFGGVTTAFNPDKTVVESATNILEQVEGELLYGRVDGIIKDGRFVLMELELIEPFLFFDYKEGAMEKFVNEAIKLFS